MALTYVASNKANVYPCAYRGQNTGGLVYDPESKMNSEKNITKNILGLEENDFLGNGGNYVIDFDGKIITFVFQGYRFTVDLTTLLPPPTSSATTGTLFAYIRLIDKQVAAGSSGVGYTTRILGNVADSSQQVPNLDINDQFEGIAFEWVPSGSTPPSYSGCKRFDILKYTKSNNAYTYSTLHMCTMSAELILNDSVGGEHSIAEQFDTNMLDVGVWARIRCNLEVGVDNDVGGNGGVAIGVDNINNYDNALMVGNGNTADADNTFSIGTNNVAGGENSMAQGLSTLALGDNQHVFGKYNRADLEGGEGKYVEIVGIGNDNEHRADARTLDWSGNELIAGSEKIGGTLEVVDDTLLRSDLTVETDANITDNLYVGGFIDCDNILNTLSVSKIQTNWYSSELIDSSSTIIPKPFEYRYIAQSVDLITILQYTQWASNPKNILFKLYFADGASNPHDPRFIDFNLVNLTKHVDAPSSYPNYIITSSGYASNGKLVLLNIVIPSNGSDPVRVFIDTDILLRHKMLYYCVL